MPSTTARQQRFMGVEYAKAKAGKPTQTKMSVGQLHDFAKKPKGGFGAHGAQMVHKKSDASAGKSRPSRAY